MNMPVRLGLILLMVIIALSGCGLNVALPATGTVSPAPSGTATSGALPAATSGALPAATSGASDATTTALAGAAPDSGPDPEAVTPPDSTATPPSAATAMPETASKGTITFAFDAFPSYFPGLIMEVNGLLKKRGYDLKLVPFLLNDQNDFSEDERFSKLQSGEWDILATTLDGFARHADPSIGAITAIVDESAGADKLVARPEIQTINDLAGKRIAFSEGSVGEYFLYYALSLAGLSKDEVLLAPQPTVAEAVQAFTSGQVDAVSAWEPDVLEAENQGGKILIASDQLRAIVDVLITSRPALTTNTEGVQAFHDAWFEALKLMIDTPPVAEQAIIKWGNSDWTFIKAPGDLPASLKNLAQANLGANQLAFRSPDTIVSRLREAQTVWAEAGQTQPQTDLSQLVDGRFVGRSAETAALFSSRPPVNSSFLLTAQVDLPQLSAQQGIQEVVQLPLEKIDFESDSLRLTDQAVKDLNEQVLPVLRSSRLYLQIEGGAAWPGPEGRFTREQVLAFARDRANSVATFLTQQGINPNRFIIGTLEPAFPNSLKDEELAQDRIVRFTLVKPEGR